MEPLDFRETELYRRWYKRVATAPPNDYLIAVSASSKTGVSGTGKSTILTILAEEFDLSEEGYDAESKSTLDAGELAYKRLPEITDRSAVVFDEAQGAPGTTGLDARRGMKTEIIDALNAILANRNKNLTVIIGSQILSTLDKRLPPILDSWLMIKREPGDPRGPMATHHVPYVDDYNFENPKVRTPAVEDLTWPKVPEDNSNYRILEEKKEKAKRKSNEEEETIHNLKNMPKPARDNEIRRLAEETELTQAEIGTVFDLTQQTVSKIVDGEA